MIILCLFDLICVHIDVTIVRIICIASTVKPAYSEYCTNAFAYLCEMPSNSNTWKFVVLKDFCLHAPVVFEIISFIRVVRF